jgi:hypothetical protein
LAAIVILAKARISLLFVFSSKIVERQGDPGFRQDDE